MWERQLSSKRSETRLTRSKMDFGLPSPPQAVQEGAQNPLACREWPDPRNKGSKFIQTQVNKYKNESPEEEIIKAQSRAFENIF